MVDELHEYVTNKTRFHFKRQTRKDSLVILYEDEEGAKRDDIDETANTTDHHVQIDDILENALPAPGPLIADTTEGLAVQLHEEVERHEMAGAVMSEEYVNEYQPHYYYWLHDEGRRSMGYWCPSSVCDIAAAKVEQSEKDSVEQKPMDRTQMNYWEIPTNSKWK